MTMEGKQSVYQQIVDRIKRDISLKIREEGDKLPSCRELAMQMGINPNTVQRAYSALEEDGFIYTIPKKGVYVGKAAKRDFLIQAEEYIAHLKRSGVKKEAIVELVEKVFEEDV